MDLLLHFFTLNLSQKPIIIFTLQFLGFLGKTGQNIPKLSLNSKINFKQNRILSHVAKKFQAL